MPLVQNTFPSTYYFKIYFPKLSRGTLTGPEVVGVGGSVWKRKGVAPQVRQICTEIKTLTLESEDIICSCVTRNKGVCALLSYTGDQLSNLKY